MRLRYTAGPVLDPSRHYPMRGAEAHEREAGYWQAVYGPWTGPRRATQQEAAADYDAPLGPPGGGPMSAAADLVRAALHEDPDLVNELRDLLGVPAEASTEPRTLHTAATLADELGVTERTIRRAIEEGELPATRRCGRWVIVAEDATAWARTGSPPTRTQSRPQRSHAGRSRGAAAIRGSNP